MPTKKEIAREMFHNFDSWESVVKKAGNGSGTYDELRDFLDTVGKQTYEDVR